ncbi:MAG: DegT/DnrJ/EryC1/StrS family aminotransferase [Candidatus Paceibacterota bacterium]
MDKKIPLSRPEITKKDRKAVENVLKTTSLSFGPKIKEFEKKMASYTKTKYAIAVNSGTSGLHLVIKSLGIKEKDEVITSSFSFIASSNCILFEKAKPVFVDIDEKTLCINADKIEEKITKKTKAILVVHVFGQTCKMDKIMKIARKHNLYVIEDACEAIGGMYKGKKSGTFKDAGVFAFYPNKQITTGEGGMIVTNNQKIAKLCKSMRNQGKDEKKEQLSYLRMGYNYRMSELNAALGVSQLERINEILKKREKAANLYNRILRKIEGIEIPYVADNVKMSWFVYAIRLNSNKFNKKDRDKIMKKLDKKGIVSKNYFPPIHLEPFYVDMFGYKRGDFPVTEKVSDLIIALPFYNNITREEIKYVCDNLKKNC